MKKIYTFTCSIIILFVISSVSFASLTYQSSVSGDEVVYDSFSGQYWYYNINDFSNKTYSQQLSLVDSLNNNGYFGLYDWHLALQSEIQSFDDNAASSIASNFNSNSSSIVQGRLGYEFIAGRHRYFKVWYTSSWEWGYGQFLDSYTDNDLGAWVTASQVPVPASLYLLGSGLIGIIGYRRKFKK